MATKLIVWTNNASSLLASGIAPSDTTVTVTAGEGALFPAIISGEYAIATLEDTSGNIEYVFITARTSDTMTITRAEEDTTALTFASGSRLELRPTAGTLATFLQKTGADTLSGTTTLAGVIAAGSGGSFQGGEIAGTAVRGAPGVTNNQILVDAGGDPATSGGSTILTTANIAANMPSGAGLMITGMVCFWSGASNAIPAGYLLCDGTHGTPDLRDQFIVGGGGSLPTSGGANSATTGSSTTGVTIAGTAITIDQIPSHSHSYWLSGITFSSNGHPGVIGIDAGGAYTANLPTYSGGPPANTPFIQSTGGLNGPGVAGAANTHTHAVTDPAHDHGVTLPPYRAVFAIMKT